jgi:hypothetical protein
MKKVLALAALLLLVGGVPASAGPSYTLPDGTVCAHMFDQYNEYGGWSGRYLCATEDNYVYYGWGPATTDPPEMIEP